MPSATKSQLLTENAGPARLQGRTAVHLDDVAAERNRSARALMVSELRYRRMFETAQYGIILLDAETGVVLEANPFVCRMLGYAQREVLDRPLWSVDAFRNAAASKHQFRDLMNQDAVRYDELPLEAKDGQIRYVEFVSTRFLADSKQLVQCNIRDVTARIQREQGARQAQDDLAAKLTTMRSREQGTHDALTGLVNPCYLDEALPRELHRAQRAKFPLTITLVDLDHLQRINTAFGQEAGDALLREVGRVMREHLRKSDMACRYGGEEFVLVLPQSTAAATLERVQQIGAAVKALELHHKNQLVDRITISAGVATAGLDGTSPRELLEAAQRALAEAKQSGGDRVVVHHNEGKKRHA